MPTPPRITPLPPSDLEDRIRDLERWTVAASDHLDTLHARDEALALVVEKLQDAAEAQAAIQLDQRLKRRSAAQLVGVVSGVGGLVMMVLHGRA
jgi:ferric-dicitrate binding protein FerR (iron transport regulator)